MFYWIMHILQHYDVSFYFSPGAQGELRGQAAMRCRASLSIPDSPSPKQKVWSGNPRGFEQDCQGCKCSWLYGRKLKAVSRKGRSVSFLMAAINLFKPHPVMKVCKQSFWWKTLVFSSEILDLFIPASPPLFLMHRGVEALSVSLAFLKSPGKHRNSQQ